MWLGIFKPRNFVLTVSAAHLYLQTILHEYCSELFVKSFITSVSS